MENKYSANFKIEWDYDNGSSWMNPDNLQLCINAYCGQDTTCRVTEQGPVMVSGNFQGPSTNNSEADNA